MPESHYTPEMAVDLQVASDVQLSPDSRWVAFCVAPIGHRTQYPTSTIFIAAADGSSPPHAITGSDHNNTSPRWSPDCQRLAFLSDRIERGKSQLYVLPLAGGEPTRLTTLEGGVQNPAWAPNGDDIYFTARRTALNGKREEQSEVHVWSEMTKPRAVGVVAAHGGPARPVGPAEGHVGTFAVRPDGEQIAALVMPSDRLSDAANRTQLVVFTPSTAAESRLLATFSRGGDRLAWSADGTLVTTINSRSPDHETAHVHLVRVGDGTVTTLADRGMTPSWTGFVEGGLLELSVAQQRSRLERLSLDGQPQSVLTDGDQLQNKWIMPQISANADGSRIALLLASDHRPADVYVLDQGNELRQLTDLNSQLASVKFADMEEVSWTGQDGMEIHGWLLRPTTDAQQPYPLIVDVHGGPSMAWGNWFHATWHDWGQVLAARGYAVLLPNPRGSTGKGQSYNSANKGDLGGQDFQDVMRGIDYLVEQGIADPEHLGIGGWSYGGYMTALTVVRTDRFKAAVAGAAVTNWVSKVGTTDIRPYNESNFAAPLHEAPDPYWMRSPVRYFKNAQTPTLVVHGEADDRVPVTQGREFFSGLQAQGVESEFVTYPRQAHAFHERAFQLDLLQRLCAWFDRYVKA